MVSASDFRRKFELSRRKRLVGYYLTGLVSLVVTYTVVYNVALLVLEGESQSIFASFEFVIQTLTTTGYGQDAGLWSHPLMFVFVALAQISGIGIGFFTLRLIIIPLFSESERNLDDRLTPKHDHVIVCEYRRDSAVLLDELDELDIDYVLLSSDREEAISLSDDGYAAIHGSPQDVAALERAGIDEARAVITDAGDATVNTILTVRSVAPGIEIITLTDDSDMREVLLDTGADSVLSPNGVLGHRLAEKAVSAFGGEFSDAIDVSDDLEVSEIPIPRESHLIGTRIRDSAIRERTGATVVGAWIDGELQLPPDPDATIQPNTVLLVTGSHDDLAVLSDIIRPAHAFDRHERIVVVGHDEVGRAATAVLADAADPIDVVTIDRREDEGVDVVGDATDRSTLEGAGIDTADAVIVGLPDDSATLLCIVLARSLNDDVEILASVSDTDATRKALRAGADYVLSVPQVSARMITRELRGEDVLAPASQIRLVRVSAGPFAGSTLADSGIYEQTGCRVIAVEDEAGHTATVDPDRRFTADERITVVGSDESIQQFLARYDVLPVDREA